MEVFKMASGRQEKSLNEYKAKFEVTAAFCSAIFGKSNFC